MEDASVAPYSMGARNHESKNKQFYSFILSISDSDFLVNHLNFKKREMENKKVNFVPFVWEVI